MDTVSRILAAMMLCLVLSACNLTAPSLASADVTIYDGGRPSRSWQLSRAQLAMFEAWLMERRVGWSPDIVTYAPKILISAKAVDGSAWSFNVGSEMVVVVGGRMQLKRSFAAADIGLLVQALGAKT